MPNQAFRSRMVPNHHMLIIFSYATLYEYITKIRMLNRKTRRLTDDSFIGREDRSWEIRCTACWLCTFELRHLEAALIGADTLEIVMEDFIDTKC